MDHKRLLGIGGLALLAITAAVGYVYSTRATPLSVVLIVVDTLRADHLGLYGSSRPTSPALDAWAGRGVVFERAHAASSWTLPSFASIYTGQLPSKHCAGAGLAPADASTPAQVVTADGERRLFSALDPTLPTLAEMLRDHGYDTAAVVNNVFLHPMFGVARGFQDYDYVPGSDDDSRPANLIVDRALTWIDSHRRKPFFLLIHLMDTHMSYNAPPPFRGRFTGAYRSAFSLPVRGTRDIRRAAPSLPAEDRQFISAAYDEEVAFADHHLGRLLEGFERRGVLDRAVVMFTADHGEELFDHNDFGHGHTMYEELLHVPFMVWAPGAHPGRRPEPVSLLDVVPTVLEAARVQPATGLAGMSLWSAITGGAAIPERPLCAEHTGSGPERKTVIEWPYKLVFTDDGSPPQFADLGADAGERAEDGVPADVRRRLLAQLKQTFPPQTQAARGQAVQLDAGTRERLRALGYVD